MIEPNISVGLMSEKKISFRLNGEHIINGDKQNVATGLIDVSYENDKIKYNEDYFDELTFTPKEKDCNFELFGFTIGKDFHWQQKVDLKFCNSIKIIVEKCKITIINILPIEIYLASVISSEMSATSSLELLKAHTVISRSWVMAQINKKIKNKNNSTIIDNETKHIKWYDRDDHDNFDVCADDHCQRYQGITRQTTSTVREAINQTKGEVLMCDDEICDARFSKSCGGVLETFENCWEETSHNYLKKVIDNEDEFDENALDLTKEDNAEKWILSNPKSFCNTTNKEILSQVLVKFDQDTKDFYRWKVEYTQKEISEIINEKSGIDFGIITDLIPLKRGESGRIIELKIIGTKKSLIVGKELEIRKFLSKSHLYSSAFIIKKEFLDSDKILKFEFYGAGWGHGVGLCQIGAAVMANKGFNYIQILNHYYKNTNIKKLW